MILINFNRNWLSAEILDVGKCILFPIKVDNNVTRHLDSTLKRDDWDILILHYLGLDHIGHISGPHSSLIQPKLLEMDDIIKKIHSALILKVISSDSHLIQYMMSH